MDKNELICNGLGDSKFTILEKDWLELQAWASISYDEDKNEISGLMTVLEIEPNKYLICNPEILKQENTGATTTLDNVEVSKYMTKWAAKLDNKKLKVSGKTFDILSPVRYCWWHSHHWMEAGWSGTDLNEIAAWKNKSWTTSLVVNLREEYQFRVNVWEPLEAFADVPLKIYRGSKMKITDTMRKKYEDLCSSPKSTVVLSTNLGYKGKLRNGYGYEWHDYNGYQTTLIPEKTEKAMIEQTLDDLGTQLITTEITWKDYLKELNDMKKAIKDEKLPFDLKIHDNEKECNQFWMHESAEKLLTFKRGGKS